MYKLYWIKADHHTDFTTEGYIGVTKQPQARFKAHTTNTNLRVGSQLVREHINEYGLDSVSMEILESFEDGESAKASEKSLRPRMNIGWNVNVGGGANPDCTGRTLNQQTKDKIASASRTTRSSRTYVSPFKGMTDRHSDETKALIGKASIGRKKPDNFQQIMHETNSGSLNPRSKAITLLDTATGATTTYGSMNIAAKALGIPSPTVRSAFQNKREYIHKRWKIV